MVDFPAGIPDLPEIQENDPPGSAAGGLGLRPLINRANDNILTIIDNEYNGIHKDYDPIINGGPMIWQQEKYVAISGTSWVSPTNAQKLCDMWEYGKTGTNTVLHTVSRSTDTPAVSAIKTSSPYSLQAVVNTADASIDADVQSSLKYKIEGYNIRRFVGRDFTMRFWVKAAKTGLHCVSIRNSDGTRSCVGTYTINDANTWEEKSITFPGLPTDGTWFYTEGIGVIIDFSLAVGSSYHTANALTWVSANALGVTGVVNENDTNGNTFKIHGLTMKVGEYCPPYNDRPYGLELLLCKRYFEAWGGIVNTTIGYGYILSSSMADIFVSMVEKRATPGIGFGNCTILSALQQGVITAVSNLSTDNRSIFARCTVSGTPFSLVMASCTIWHGSTGGIFQVDARL